MDKLLTGITPADANNATDFAGLARLKSEAAAHSPEALKKVAQQFEALFLQMMLKSMRDANLSEGAFDSNATEMYQGMFDKQVALDLAKRNNGGLGIADMLVRQLAPPAVKTPQVPGALLPIEKPVTLLPIDSGAAAPIPLPAKPALHFPQRTGESAGEDTAGNDAGQATTGLSSSWRPNTPEEFVRQILPHAQKAAAALNVHPLGLVAQAALETGWGQHVIPGNDGASSMNLFGIKAGDSWQGGKAVAGTLEFEGGLPVARQASFRRYGSVAESFDDYARLLGNSSRYKEVLERGQTLEGFAEALGRTGYATDPRYADKIKGVLSSDTLRNALASLKTGGPAPIT